MTSNQKVHYDLVVNTGKSGMTKPGGRSVPFYINSTIFLFMGGFMIALTMEDWNLHKRIALFIIRIIGAFDKLAGTSKPVMLVGGYASDPTYRLARMAEDADMPFLICTASADKITQRGWKNIYRLSPPVSEYTNGLEDFWIKNYKPKSLLCGGAGGFTLEEFIIRAGGAANYLLTASLWSEHVRYPGAGKYYAQYTEQYSRSPDYHGAEAYSALLVAAEALKRSKSFSPQDIRNALNQFI